MLRDSAYVLSKLILKLSEVFEVMRNIYEIIHICTAVVDESEA